VSLSSTISLSGGSSSALALLTSAQRERLTEVLDRYLAAQERGHPLVEEALLAEHPDLADALRVYLRSLADLHDMAAGFSPLPAGAEPWPDETCRGKCLGDFELIREIGRGGMGVVYEARQISLDRLVALKMLPFAAVLDARQIARFKHEARAAAQLHHPNIVPVFAIGVERGVHYYAMQLINGQPLDRAIAELRTSLSYPDDGGSEHFRTVCRLGIQAAEALQAAHEYGVVHRDIKPSNLLLEASGKLWVADFGLARCRTTSALTRTGDLIGTMRYMSPEQATGRSECIDQRTDIYSLGATLYELACLRPALAGCEGPALLHRIERQEPLRPRLVRPEIPLDLETVILKALAKDRGDRYVTARELAEDLRRVLEGQPTFAKPPTSIECVVRLARRHRWAVGAAVSVLVLAMIGLAAGAMLIAHETNRTELASADRYSHDARKLLDQFGVQIAQRLADVPGAEQVRKDLLTQTQAYYQNFAVEARRDPELKSELARTYAKIATLLDEAGTTEAAVAAHRQAVELLSQLAAANPEQADYQQQLAQREGNLALALGRSGKTDQARQHFAEAIRLQQRLLAKEPADDTLLAELARSFSDLGLLERKIGRLDQSQASLRQAIDLLEKALSDLPNDVDRQSRLASAYNNLAATYYLDAAPEKAIELHQQALSLQTAAASARPADLTLRRSVPVTYNNLGRSYSRLGRLRIALENYEKAIAIQEELAQLAPAERTPQRDLATSLNNRGLLCQRLGWAEEAEAMLRRALAIQERLVAQAPDDDSDQSSLGGIWHNLGIVLDGEHRPAEAVAALASAMEHQRIAAQRAPEVAQYRDLLDRHSRHRELLLQKLEGIAAAQDSVELPASPVSSIDLEDSEP
jgi:eukaryotic-like serine/threonine-protein kinase